MKTLLKLTTIFLLFISTISFAQSVTYSLSHSGANDLVIGTDGNFYNKDGSGVLTPTTVTITCVANFVSQSTLDNFTGYRNAFFPIKDGSTNIFVENGGFSTSKAATDNATGDLATIKTAIANNGFIHTRTWTRTSLSIATGVTPVANTNTKVVPSGGFAESAPNVSLIAATFGYNNLIIPIVNPPSSDNTPPVITLNGDAVVYLNLNDSYIELGATATDDTDGNISGNIVTGGDTVDTSVTGVYTITYNVSDAAGNAADEVTREVRVGIITNITVSQVPLTISADGTLDRPLIFTVSNIPASTPISINSRSYNSDISTVNGGSQLGSFSNTLFNLEYDGAATYPLVSENGAVKVETTEAVNGQFNRTFTIKNHAALTTAPTTTDVILAIRFVAAVSNGYVFDPGLTAGTGGTLDNKSFILASSVAYYTASAKDFNISKFIYPNPVSSELTISKEVITDTYKVVNLLGRTVKEVNAIGKLDVSDLTTGIYILVTDAGVAKFVKK